MGLKENITFLSFTTFKLLLCVQYTFPVSYGGGHLCVPQSFFFFRCFFFVGRRVILMLSFLKKTFNNTASEVAGQRDRNATRIVN
jgi:hypothetical protein